VYSASAIRSGEFRVVEAHLSQNALDPIDVAGTNGHQRDIAFHLVSRKMNVSNIVGLAPSQRGDVDYPSPATELNDQREIGSRRNI
jgi:hypothetical protein